VAFVLHYVVCHELPDKQVPFDCAQGRVRCAQDDSFFEMNIGDGTLASHGKN
jgi:hypothetical protein